MPTPTIHVYLIVLVNIVLKKNTMIFRGVDSYLPRFTSPHGQNLLLTHSVASNNSNNPRRRTSTFRETLSFYKNRRCTYVFAAKSRKTCSSHSHVYKSADLIAGDTRIARKNETCHARGFHCSLDQSENTPSF